MVTRRSWRYALVVVDEPRGVRRVLLVEDSETDAKLIVRALRTSGHDVVSRRVETADALRAALAEGSWDVLISDWSLPQFGAPAALAILKESGLDIPFIIVSGTVGEETAVEAMRSGASDFVLKDRLARLVPAVERELREREVRRSRGRAEKALGEAEARFARLSESGIVGIAYADIDGNVKDANEAYLRMLGYTRDNLPDELNWRRSTPLQWAETDDRVFEQLRATGVARPFEKELVHRDGTRVPVLMGVAMLDEINCIAFVADLTERKRAEAALRRSEEQLRHAQKMEAIGSLAGGIAHDFNNLLTVILSYCAVAIHGMPPTDPLRADLTEVHRAGERAAELTRQLLAFSRRQVLQPRLLDLGDVLAGMAKMLRRLLGEDVELAIKCAEEIGLVKLDRGQIEQVVMNLAVNARDAMPRGGKLLIETAEVELDEDHVAEHVGTSVGRNVMLAVSDNGCGMDGATRARIFEPFFTTKEVKGTGLGLSTVLGIVQQSGGTIWVYSEPGLGTTFRIYFPVAAGGRVEASSDSAADAGDLRGTETILLVEDDPQVRVLAHTILRRQGYQVLEAQSGGDALLISELHSGPIALLLTDVVMPRLSGRELAERLAVTRPELRTLYMSGYTDDAVVRHGVLESDVSFLQKPFNAETLTRKVRETLDKPRATD